MFGCISFFIISFHFQFCYTKDLLKTESTQVDLATGSALIDAALTTSAVRSSHLLSQRETSEPTTPSPAQYPPLAEPPPSENAQTA